MSKQIDSLCVRRVSRVCGYNLCFHLFPKISQEIIEGGGRGKGGGGGGRRRREGEKGGERRRRGVEMSICFYNT